MIPVDKKRVRIIPEHKGDIIRKSGTPYDCYTIQELVKPRFGKPYWRDVLFYESKKDAEETVKILVGDI